MCTHTRRHCISNAIKPSDIVHIENFIEGEGVREEEREGESERKKYEESGRERARERLTESERSLILDLFPQCIYLKVF